MKTGVSLLVFAVLALAACERAQAPSAAPSPTAAISPAPTPHAAAPSVEPSAAASPEAAADEVDDNDIDKPWGPEFEIDADADQYYAIPGTVVKFNAFPLNGSPPFSYVWDFGDGSPTVTVPRTEHRYATLGDHTAFVIGSDGNGETYRVNLIISIITPERYARIKQRKGVPWTPPSPAWTPAPSP
jgi:hypothetical protein